jgi:hypothetical protein
MKIIDNAHCIERIEELFSPLEEFFKIEEARETLEQHIFSESEEAQMIRLASQSLSEQNEMFRYINILTYDYPGRDLMKIILKELYSYVRGNKDYTINQWNLVRNFKLLITDESDSETIPQIPSDTGEEKK